MTQKKSIADMRSEVRHEARVGIAEINNDARAAKQFVKENYREMTREGVQAGLRKQDYRTEAKYIIEDIENDRRDGVDSVRDLRDEFLSGKSRSARKTGQQIKDAVDETEYQIEQDTL